MDLSGELEEVIKRTLEDISRGTEDSGYTVNEVEFDFAVVKTKTGKGGFKIVVADASGKYSKEQVTRITFKAVKERRKTMPSGVRRGDVWRIITTNG